MERLSRMLLTGSSRLQEDRMEQIERWASFKRGFDWRSHLHSLASGVAVVMLGEPPAAFKKYGQESFVGMSFRAF